MNYINQLTEEDKYSIGQFVMLYSTNQFATGEAHNVIRILHRIQIINNPSELSIGLHDKETSGKIMSELIVTLGKFIPDSEMKKIMLERVAKVRDRNPSLKIRDVEEIPIVLNITNRQFLSAAIDRSMKKQPPGVASVFPKNIEYLKLISKKLMNMQEDIVLLSAAQANTLAGYVRAAIEETNHRRYKEIDKELTSAIQRWEFENKDIINK